MKFTNLFSSSKGNSLLVEDKDTKILIDAGLAGKHIIGELSAVGVDINEIDAILLTHEHSDHMRGVGVLSRRADIPVYVHRDVVSYMKRYCGRISEKNIVRISPEEPFIIKDLKIKGFRIPHDAIAPMGFAVDNAKVKMAVATDMGFAAKEIVAELKECSFVFLEANHDEEMLINGPYPYPLKRRILSKAGHLSNDMSGNIVGEIVKGKTERIRLGHLSAENNTSLKAYNTVISRAEKRGVEVEKDYILDVANRRGVNESIEI